MKRTYAASFVPQRTCTIYMSTRTESIKGGSITSKMHGLHLVQIQMTMGTIQAFTLTLQWPCKAKCPFLRDCLGCRTKGTGRSISS